MPSSPSFFFFGAGVFVTLFCHNLNENNTYYNVRVFYLTSLPGWGSDSSGLWDRGDWMNQVHTTGLFHPVLKDTVIFNHFMIYNNNTKNSPVTCVQKS